jgi:hypothetical protein
MSDDGFHDSGWYPHDGEGKIDNCPGPGCDCDEKNYGHHSSSSNGNLSIIGTILCMVGGLFCVSAIYLLFGIDVDDVPAIVSLILWIVFTSVLAAIGSKHGL